MLDEKFHKGIISHSCRYDVIFCPVGGVGFSLLSGMSLGAEREVISAERVGRRSLHVPYVAGLGGRGSDSNLTAAMKRCCCGADIPGEKWNEGIRTKSRVGSRSCRF